MFVYVCFTFIKHGHTEIENVLKIGFMRYAINKLAYTKYF